MSSNFVLWSFEEVPNALVTDRLRGANNAGERRNLVSGKPFLDTFGGQLQFTADPDYPDDLLLIDTFSNTASVFPISLALKNFLVSKHLLEIEFVPVNMLDHRDNVVGEYYLLHPLIPVDCIDIEKSDVKVDRLNEEMFNTVRELVLNEGNIPQQRKIFRIKGLYDAIAVERSLAEELSGQKFIGLDWIEIDEYSY